jgi:hypothetical protein
MDLRRFTTLVSSLNGRDKFSKALQHGSKLSHYFLQSSNTEIAGKLHRFSIGVGQSRKVDRLLKTTVEIQKILDAMKNSKNDTIIKYLTILSAAMYGVYWFHDNCVFLGKLKVLSNLNVKETVRKGTKYQFMGIFLLLILLHYKIRKLQENIIQCKQNMNINSNSNNNTNTTTIMMNGNGSNNVNNNIEQQKQHFLLCKQLRNNRIMIFGLLCDIIVSGNNCGLVEYFRGGQKFNSGIVGLCGFMAALSVLYRIY